MLKCNDVASRASGLLDGELGTRSTLRLWLHLAICKGCRRFIRQMNVTNELVRQSGRAETPTSIEGEEARMDEILSQANGGGDQLGKP